MTGRDPSWLDSWKRASDLHAFHGNEALNQYTGIAHVALTFTRSWCADSVRIVVSYVEARPHLPVVSLERAA